MFQKQEILANKSSGVSAGIEKLLSNKFARQVQLILPVVHFTIMFVAVYLKYLYIS